MTTCMDGAWRRSSSAHQGFTLIEVMLVLGLMGLLGQVLVPNWQAALAASNVTRHQEAFKRLVMQARTWALLHQQPAVICGWSESCIAGAESAELTEQSLATSMHKATILAFVDSNLDQIWQADEAVIARLSLHHVQVTFNRNNFVRFSAQGTTGQAGSWHLCPVNTTQTDSGKRLVVNSSGSLRSDKATCAN